MKFIAYAFTLLSENNCELIKANKYETDSLVATNIADLI